MGVAAADFDNDGFTDVLITAVGQNHLFHNTGKGTFADVTTKAGLGARAGFSTSALWFDYDRDGLARSADLQLRQVDAGGGRLLQRGRQAEGRTARRQRIGARRRGCSATSGNGTFEDVTAKARLFDATSKSLGVTLLDYDLDVWPDVFIANDTQPNKLYRNNGNGTFTELGLQAGLALSEEGRARAGMGVGCRRRRQQRQAVGRRDELQRRDAGALQACRRRTIRRRVAAQRHRPRHPAHARLWLLLLRRGSRRPAGPARRQRPHRRHDQQGRRRASLRRVAASVPESRRRPIPRHRGHDAWRIRQPKVGRGAAFGDFDGDGVPTSSSRPTLDRRSCTATMSGTGTR